MPKLMDNCKDISRLVSDRMDRPLSWGKRLRIRVHLMMCRGCSNFARQMGTIRSASRLLAERLGSERDRPQR
jgi:hypothetical protein